MRLLILNKKALITIIIFLVLLITIFSVSIIYNRTDVYGNVKVQ